MSEPMPVKASEIRKVARAYAREHNPLLDEGGHLAVEDTEQWFFIIEGLSIPILFRFGLFDSEPVPEEILNELRKRGWYNGVVVSYQGSEYRVVPLNLAITAWQREQEMFQERQDTGCDEQGMLLVPVDAIDMSG